MRIDMGTELRLSDLAERVESLGARVEGLKIVTEGDERHLAARLQLGPTLSADELAEQISDIEGVYNVDWQP